MKKDAENRRGNKTLNQWKLFIQKNLNNISLDLLNVDHDK